MSRAADPTASKIYHIQLLVSTRPMEKTFSTRVFFFLNICIKGHGPKFVEEDITKSHLKMTPGEGHVRHKVWGRGQLCLNLPQSLPLVVFWWMEITDTEVFLNFANIYKLSWLYELYKYMNISYKCSINDTYDIVLSWISVINRNLCPFT